LRQSGIIVLVHYRGAISAGSGRLDGGILAPDDQRAAAALPSVIGGPGKDFNSVSDIGPAMAARIAWSAAWARSPALV
jgi:hypothetical protein